MLFKKPVCIRKRGVEGLCFPIPQDVITRLALDHDVEYDMEVSDDGREIKYTLKGA